MKCQNCGRMFDDGPHCPYCGTLNKITSVEKYSEAKYEVRSKQIKRKEDKKQKKQMSEQFSLGMKAVFLLLSVVVTIAVMISIIGELHNQANLQPFHVTLNTKEAEETSRRAAVEIEKREYEKVEESSSDTGVVEDGYIIADSDSRYITAEDLKVLNRDELRYARNEIYARHGRRFNDKKLQDYFNSKSWYQGSINPDNFNESVLNDYEKKNAKMILEYEKSKGYV